MGYKFFTAQAIAMATSLYNVCKWGDDVSFRGDGDYLNGIRNMKIKRGKKRNNRKKK